jgi:hypothetical protein
MPFLHLQHLLNVLVKIANKMGLLKKKISYCSEANIKRQIQLALYV